MRNAQTDGDSENPSGSGAVWRRVHDSQGTRHRLRRCSRRRRARDFYLFEVNYIDDKKRI